MEKDETDILSGLNEDAVRRSREKHGENRLSRQKRKSFLKSFFESFGDPLIKILLIALAVNIIFLFRNANWFESLGIAVAILLATFVSTLSEYGSESAFEKLQEEAARINCRVKRAEGLREIPIDQVVVGDLVQLQPGDRVPADGIILSGRLDIDQSILNGESKEAPKYPCKPGAEQDDFLDPAMLFSGTVVCAGEGLMRVLAVGDSSVYGRIGSEIQEENRESPLSLRLSELASGIGKFGYIAAAVSVVAYLFNEIFLDNRFNPDLIARTVGSPGLMLGHIIHAATLAVTVIVMAVPEGLPMMITVVLSANMRRMLKDNVLVRKLMGIETAGSLNILFTDKTGTLTRGKLEAVYFVNGLGDVLTMDELCKSAIRLRGVLRDSIYYNCAAVIETSKDGSKRAIGGNATDRAALDLAEKLGSDKLGAMKRNITKGKCIPFSSDTKFMATAISGAWNTTLIKGVPEKILPYCTRFYNVEGGVSELRGKRKLESALKRLADQSIRIIAIAISDQPVSEAGEFNNLTLVGLLGIRDELRPESVTGVRLVRSAGVQTVMITGDSRATALAIAKETGLVEGSDDIILTSEELKAISDDKLADILPKLRVVARALPSDKSRLVRIAKLKGLVVGMTGDGVNDAPALKQADIGFAMGSGTEIAKEAGDIVILDDNFSSIAKAICYGRTIFKSIRKFIIYQMSICMCAVGVTVVGPLIGVDFPITVIQMLWINIVMDTLAGLAFSGEIARRKYMEEPPKSRAEPIINGYMTGQIASISIYSAILCLLFLKLPFLRNIFAGRGDIYVMTAFFALFMFSAIFSSFCARTHQVDLLDYLSANKPFIWIMSAITVIQIGIIYFGGPIFRTAGLDLSHMLLIVLLAFTIIPVDTIRKQILTRKPGYSGT